METPSPEDLSGRLLAGRYRVERLLRRGGMGAVYVGHDLQAGRAVALKLVKQSLLEDPQAIARFKREARLATEIAHENIVSCLDAGDDGGVLYIAMELLSGTTLRDHLEGRGRFSWQDSLTIVEQIVRALGVAHARGVVHRDLKPENVMVVETAPPRVKLLDFGVAKQARIDGESGATSMTGTGFIVGTPGYVAPEAVLEGRTDDPRSDFYALGVVWFELLTGQKPFTGKTAFALAMRHAHEQAPTPSSFVPFSPIPAPVERLVLRLMAKSPDDRVQTADELLMQISRLFEESQLSSLGSPRADAAEHTVTDDRFQAGQTDVFPRASATPATMAARLLLVGSGAAPESPAGTSRRGRMLGALALLLAVSLAGIVGVLALVITGRVESPARPTVPLRPHSAPSPAADRSQGAVALDSGPRATQSAEAKALPVPMEADSSHATDDAHHQARQAMVSEAVSESTSTARASAEATARVARGKPATNATSEQGALTTVAPLAPSSRAPATVKIRPAAGWKIALDREAPREGNRPPMSVPAGRHPVTFESTTDGKLIERELVLEPGATVTITDPSSVGEAQP